MDPMTLSAICLGVAVVAFLLIIPFLFWRSR
mgnify:CR=1 FL=1